MSIRIFRNKKKIHTKARTVIKSCKNPRKIKSRISTPQTHPSVSLPLRMPYHHPLNIPKVIKTNTEPYHCIPLQLGTHEIRHKQNAVIYTLVLLRSLHFLCIISHTLSLLYLR